MESTRSSNPSLTMQLILYPDPILKQRARELESVDQDVRDRISRMFEVMYEERGVGLAAPQVGWNARVFVMNTADEQEPAGERVFINPRIVERSGETIDEEGCLSIPEIRGKVRRAAEVLIEAENEDGEVFRDGLSDLPARVFQHELDHLDGILFIRYLSATEKLFAKKVLRRLEKEYEERQKRAGAATRLGGRASRAPGRAASEP